MNRISMHDYEDLHYHKEKLKEACKCKHTHSVPTVPHLIYVCVFLFIQIMHMSFSRVIYHGCTMYYCLQPICTCPLSTLFISGTMHIVGDPTLDNHLPGVVWIEGHFSFITDTDVKMAW